MAEDIECMCQIMSTIGRRLDTPKAFNIMNQYFDRIELLSKSSELPSRIRFMLKDVMELRGNQVRSNNCPLCCFFRIFHFITLILSNFTLP